MGCTEREMTESIRYDLDIKCESRRLSRGRRWFPAAASGVEHDPVDGPGKPAHPGRGSVRWPAADIRLVAVGRRRGHRGGTADPPPPDPAHRPARALRGAAGRGPGRPPPAPRPPP